MDAISGMFSRQGTASCQTHRAPCVHQARDLLQNFEERGLDEDAGVALTVVEDDSEDGCSWCPVSTMPGRDEDERASLDFCMKGEQFKSSKKWQEALGCFNRAAVANPLNSKNWISIAEVSQWGEVATLNAFSVWTQLTLVTPRD